MEKRHEQRDDQRHRRAGADLQNHLKGVLDVGDVGGQARDKPAVENLSMLEKGICLNPPEHGFAQIARQPVLARALCTPARTPKNIARIAITAISADLRDVRHVPTAMPLSMMDAVRLRIKFRE